jgi:hypothetical protein
MRFQKTNFSDYLKAPEPVSSESELTTAAPETGDLLDAETVAEQLESLLAASRAAGSETPAAASPPSPPSPPPPPPPNPAYDLLPAARHPLLTHVHS